MFRKSSLILVSCVNPLIRNSHSELARYSHISFADNLFYTGIIYCFNLSVVFAAWRWWYHLLSKNTSNWKWWIIPLSRCSFIFRIRAQSPSTVLWSFCYMLTWINFLIVEASILFVFLGLTLAWWESWLDHILIIIISWRLIVSWLTVAHRWTCLNLIWPLDLWQMCKLLLESSF